MGNLIICDRENRRVVRWSRHSGTTKGEIRIDNIGCWGLAMDNQRYLYVSDVEKSEVKRYEIGDTNGIVVAGGNGKGNGLNQLKFPSYLFVDRQQALYVSGQNNHRVIKWNKDAKEGIVVVEGIKEAMVETKLLYSYGLFVDKLGTVYVADSGNNLVIRCYQGKKYGSTIVGGYYSARSNVTCLGGFSFDRHGDLYVVDWGNDRVQRFAIK